MSIIGISEPHVGRSCRQSQDSAAFRQAARGDVYDRVKAWFSDAETAYWETKAGHLPSTRFEKSWVTTRKPHAPEHHFETCPFGIFRDRTHPIL